MSDTVLFVTSKGSESITIYSMYKEDEHRLSEKDIKAADKMNFRSTMLLCNPQIWKLLEKIN